MNYNLNQLAMITGLTTRTLRNHIKQGILTGEKGSDIEFRFINEKNYARFILSGSEEQVSEFMRAYYEK